MRIIIKVNSLIDLATPDEKAQSITIECYNWSLQQFGAQLNCTSLFQSAMLLADKILFDDDYVLMHLYESIFSNV